MQKAITRNSDLLKCSKESPETGILNTLFDFMK